jgi:hypothetical protein
MNLLVKKPLEDSAQLSEASWLYLSAAHAERAGDLTNQLASACEDAGWLAYVATEPCGASSSDCSAPLGAIREAGAVVLYLNDCSERVEEELRVAREWGRPIMALTVGPQDRSSALGALLEDYGPVRFLQCDSAAECGDSLRDALRKPEWRDVLAECSMPVRDDLV